MEPTLARPWQRGKVYFMANASTVEREQQASSEQMKNKVLLSLYRLRQTPRMTRVFIDFRVAIGEVEQHNQVVLPSIIVLCCVVRVTMTIRVNLASTRQYVLYYTSHARSNHRPAIKFRVWSSKHHKSVPYFSSLHHSGVGSCRGCAKVCAGSRC